MTEASTKRGSIQSEASEFSFENGEDNTSLLHTAIASPSKRLPSPVRPAVRAENLARQNSELEETVGEQSVLISALRNHISLLEKQLGSNGIKIPPFIEPANFKSSSSADLSPLKIDISKAKSLDQLSLPPRSADRLKTSPLKSPSKPKPSQLSTPSPDEILQPYLDEEEKDIDPTPVIQMDCQDQNTTLTPGTESEQEDKRIQTKEKDHEKELSTPVESTPDIDWQAQIEALKVSNEEAQESKQNKSATKAESKQVTPYSGRIQNGSPSPYKSSNKSSLYDQSPAHSNLSSSTTSKDNKAEQIIEKTSSLPKTQEHLVSENSKPYAPVSPLRLQFNKSQTTQSSRISPYGSVPNTPMSTTSATPNTPLSKSNIYDPYVGDFHHQQIYQDQNGFGGHYNASNELIDFQQPQQQPQQQSHEGLQEAHHVRYPSDVPLFVDPLHLSTVRPEVISTIHGNPSKKGDDPSISIAVYDRQTNKEMWRFKKFLSQILQLDTQIRPLINSFSLPPVPEKSLFLTNIPVKVDQRRLRLRDYFSTLFSIPNIPQTAAYKIARFMSLDVINLLDESNTEVLKDGWLLRRAKGIGNNWKARYCQIDGQTMLIFDSLNGALLESIRLTSAQIGKQPDNVKLSDDKNALRHAFAVMEPKKNMKTYTKYVFCCETDQDRDSWVDVLVQFVDETGAPSIYSAESSIQGSSYSNTAANSEINVTSPSSSNTVSPIKGNNTTTPTKNNNNTINSHEDDFVDYREVSKETKKHRKRSFFPFSKKQYSDETNDHENNSNNNDNRSTIGLPSNIEKSLQDMNLEPSSISLNTNNVFRNELSEVVKLSTHEMYGLQVPSIIYRCLSYLIEKSAVYEEGLFRLNGSSALIKSLRETFDREYDVDYYKLDPNPDINSIAGLLKLWFRELPTSILTRECYPRFKDACSQIRDLRDLSLEYKKIVKFLPQENYAVLYALFKFLSDVIQNKESNKMNLRNLCIVFSPTLNIASDVVIPFLVDFKCIFENGEPISNDDREVMDVNIPTF